MKWEFSSMMTVSMMLILVPFTSEFEQLVFENLWFNLFPGLTFLFVGFVGGLLTESEYKKAVAMMASSYAVIGLFTTLAVSINCVEAQCYYIGYTLVGIPIGIILTTVGGILGYKLRIFKMGEDDSESSQN